MLAIIITITVVVVISTFYHVFNKSVYEATVLEIGDETR